VDHVNVDSETPAAGSAASSFVSSSGIPVDSMDFSSIQSPIIYQPNTPLSIVPSSPNSHIDHKRSQPQLRPKQKDHDLPVLTPRPLTAGSPTKGKTRTYEPEPPLPPLPTFTRTHPRRPSGDQASDTTGSEGRPNSYLTTDIGTDPTDGDFPGTSPSGGATATLMRASRKLSLTSPLLGFGKDKHKEREKEAKAGAKDRPKDERVRKEQEAIGFTPNAFS